MPSRSDYYLMQIAQKIVNLFRKTPSKLFDLMLPLKTKRRTEQLNYKESKKKNADSIAGWISITGKPR